MLRTKTGPEASIFGPMFPDVGTTLWSADSDQGQGHQSFYPSSACLMTTFLFLPSSVVAKFVQSTKKWLLIRIRFKMAAELLVRILCDCKASADIE